MYGNEAGRDGAAVRCSPLVATGIE